MPDEYGAERIAAARQRIRYIEADPAVLYGGYTALSCTKELRAALDALEAAQKELHRRRTTAEIDGDCTEWWSARAEAAEAEVARLAAENASLLRRIEGLRLAVWGNKGVPRP